MSEACATGGGFVWLVGAGPGPADLLTLRAARVLGEAQVVVHDRLVSREVLDLIPASAARIDVGKRRGDHRMAQHDINALLVQLAAIGQRVVRLKGGDPLVFARGGEEAQALAQAGVDYDIVPGITAANACAASARIPLTHRGVASGCTFITGHGKDADLDHDWHALARSRETLVVYMGLHALARIAARLMAFGRSPDTPVAVIERGGSAQQRVITAPLRSIAARTRVAGIASPALLVIGEVVNLREVLQGVAPAPEISVSGPLAAA